MRIEVRGKNVQVTPELREAVMQRFQRVGKQVSEWAMLEVELCEERNQICTFGISWSRWQMVPRRMAWTFCSSPGVVE